MFHFLIEEEDGRRYIGRVSHGLRSRGHIIIVTFAADGPERRSRLNVVRYSPTELRAELGESFELLESQLENDQTPFDTMQKFI